MPGYLATSHLQPSPPRLLEVAGFKSDCAAATRPRNKTAVAKRAYAWANFASFVRRDDGPPRLSVPPRTKWENSLLRCVPAANAIRRIHLTDPCGLHDSKSCYRSRLSAKNVVPQRARGPARVHRPLTFIIRPAAFRPQQERDVIL